MVLLLNAHLAGLMIASIYQAKWKLAAKMHMRKRAESICLEMGVINIDNSTSTNMQTFVKRKMASKCMSSINNI